jgi:RND family efflux transporter MFP subunit
MSVKKSIITIILMAIIVGGGFVVSQKLLKTAPKAQKKQPPHIVTRVETRVFDTNPKVIEYVANGEIKAKTESTISAQISGVVEYISPSLIEGATIKKGELLLKIDRSDYYANYLQALANLKSAEASLKLQQAKSDVAKNDYILLDKKVSKEQLPLILKVPELNQAKANVEVAKSNLQLAQNNLDRCRIYAPYSGVVTAKSVDIASMVNSGTNIATIISTDEYLIQSAIDSKYLPYIEVGSEVDVVSIYSDKKIAKAKVYKILPNIDTTTKRAKILISIKNPLNQKEPLLIGSYTKLLIKSKPLNIVSMPIEYLRGDSVWVAKSGRLKSKKANILYRGDGVVYIDNIKGDKIITTNLQRVSEDMEIKVSGNKNDK